MPPAYVSHTRDAQDDVGFEHFYIKEVKTNGANLSAPDSFVKGQVRVDTEVDEGLMAKLINGDGKRPIGLTYDPAANTLIMHVKDFSSNIEKFTKKAVGKRYAVVFPVGPNKGKDGSTNKNLFKLRYYPILALDPNWKEKTNADGTTELKFLIMPNTGTSALTLTGLDEITGLTNGATEMQLDSEAYADLAFSVAPGETSDVQDCLMNY